MKTTGTTTAAVTTVAETQQQKLVRLANARVNKAIKAISLVANLDAYNPTKEQVENIVGALHVAVDAVNTELQPQVASPAKPTFSL